MIYRLLFIIGLTMLSLWTAEDLLLIKGIEDIFDIAYGSRMPLSLQIFMMMFFWYEMFTTAYKLEIRENHTIKASSLLKTTEIRVEDVVSVSDYSYSVTVLHKKGRLKVTTLIDGIGNVKNLFPVSHEQRQEHSDNFEIYRRVLPFVFIALLVIQILYNWSKYIS
jgi:hypothetical protein